MNSLTSELRDLRAQLEEAAAAHAQEAKRLQEQARDLGRQRESCGREVSPLPTPFRAAPPACCWGPGSVGVQKDERLFPAFKGAHAQPTEKGGGKHVLSPCYVHVGRGHSGGPCPLASSVG